LAFPAAALSSTTAERMAIAAKAGGEGGADVGLLAGLW